MPSVVLQQVTSKFARSNASRTLEKPIALKHLRNHLQADDYQELEAICNQGRLYVWGAKSERMHQFEKIPPRQSLVLFRRGAMVYKCGVIIQWLFNPDLAEKLWGLDADGETWGLVYFLED